MNVSDLLLILTTLGFIAAILFYTISHFQLCHIQHSYLVLIPKAFEFLIQSVFHNHFVQINILVVYF